jgi:hypothetical protein
MEQPISQSLGSNLPWLIRRSGRITSAIVAIAVAYLLTMNLPDELNLLIPYDVGVAVYLALCCALGEPQPRTRPGYRAAGSRTTGWR